MAYHTAQLTDDDRAFLDSWEEVYKRGILTFWVLYYLSTDNHDAASLYAMLSDNDTSLNEHSLYRMLRRLYDVGIIDQTSSDGRRKYYHISQKGQRVLNAFVERNIAPLPSSHNT